MIAIYIAKKIISGELEYSFVISRRPDLKDGIDAYLIDSGYGGLITA